MNSVTSIEQDLRDCADPKRVKDLLRYFKTGKGEYGYGDLFLGNTVPQVRSIAKKYRDSTLDQAIHVLHSPYHELRLAALFIMVRKANTATPSELEKIVSAYLANTAYINNWDLVDSSASQILGTYLVKTNNYSLLDSLAMSGLLWERRIAIIATLALVRQQVFQPSIHVAELLLRDSQDLIQKAVGWVLREVGKCDLRVLCTFLDVHADDMPRTMLRYSLEKMTPSKRLFYMRNSTRTKGH